MLIEDSTGKNGGTSASVPQQRRTTNSTVFFLPFFFLLQIGQLHRSERSNNFFFTNVNINPVVVVVARTLYTLRYIEQKPAELSAISIHPSSGRKSITHIFFSLYMPSFSFVLVESLNTTWSIFLFFYFSFSFSCLFSSWRGARLFHRFETVFLSSDSVWSLFWIIFLMICVSHGLFVGVESVGDA